MSFHAGEMQYAGGVYVGLRQQRGGGIGPVVAIFRDMGDDGPIVVLDAVDANELADALRDTAAEIEVAR